MIRYLLVIWHTLTHPLIRINYRKHIPYGWHCYGNTSPITDSNGNHIGYETEPCKFKSYYQGQLYLLDGGDCYDDSCKTCGINIEEEE